MMRASSSSNTTVSSSNNDNNNNSSSDTKYKGVRKRKWGKWVSEVRLPNSRDRIWLGSYDSPEKAARAFDAATFCLRGQKARLNFPDNPPQIPTTGSMTHQEVQEAATRHANSGPMEEEATVMTTPTTVDSSETSAEVVVAATSVTDWPYMDCMNEGYSINYYDYGYDFMMTGPTQPHERGEDEEGGNGFGTSLWSF